MAPESRIDVHMRAEPKAEDLDVPWSESGSDGYTPAASDTIIYPANAQTVTSPVTFNGTTTPGAIVELWDTPLAYWGIIDATAGSPTANINFPTTTANMPTACLFTGFPGGTVTKARVWFDTKQANPYGVKAVVYTGAAGITNVKSIAASGAAVSAAVLGDNITVNSWTEFTFPTPFSLTAGDYWLGVISNIGDGFKTPGWVTGTTERDGSGGTYAAPSAWTPGATSTYRRAIHLVYY